MTSLQELIIKSGRGLSSAARLSSTELVSSPKFIFLATHPTQPTGVNRLLPGSVVLTRS